MKGVVLSGGKGTRLRPITYSMTKQLVPVANQPILFYGLQDIAAIGVEETAIIISPETGAEVRAAVGDGSRFGMRVRYVEQPEPDGIASALGLTREFVGDDDVILYLGDNLVEGGVAGVAADFRRDRPNCQVMLAEVDEPEHFGVAELGSDGAIARLVEKPKHSESNLALVGIYLFDRTIWDAVDWLVPSERGLYEITDAIQRLLDTGREVRATPISGWWKDTGRKEDLLHANELLLTRLEDDVRGAVTGGRVTGPLAVGPGSTLTDCEVTGPVIVGRDCTVTGARLGPFTAVGDGCRLDGCWLERTIVMEGAIVAGWSVRDGLLGRGSQLTGTAPAGTVTVTLGEQSGVGPA